MSNISFCSIQLTPLHLRRVMGEANAFQAFANISGSRGRYEESSPLQDLHQAPLRTIHTRMWSHILLFGQSTTASEWFIPWLILHIVPDKLVWWYSEQEEKKELSRLSCNCHFAAFP